MCELQAESVYNSTQVGNKGVLGHYDTHEDVANAQVAIVPTGVSI